MRAVSLSRAIRLVALVTPLAVLLPAAARGDAPPAPPPSEQVAASGAEWSCWDTGEVADPCRGWLNDVAMASATEGWAVGRTSLHLVDGEWRLAPLPAASELFDVDVAVPGSVWVIGRDTNGASRIWNRSGSAWRSMDAPAGVATLTAIDVATDTSGWLAGTDRDGVNALYSFDGVSWTQRFTTGASVIAAIDMVSAETGWAVGGADPGIILRYGDGRWAPEAAPAAQALLGLDMLSADEGWAVGGVNGQPWILHYQGGTWTRQETTWWGWLEDVQAWSPTDVWAVGAFGGVYHYDGQWRQVPLSPYIYNLQSLAMVSPESGWAAGSGGALVRYAGGAWQTVTPADLLSVDVVPASSLSPDEAWAVGHAGRILHFDGTAWSAVPSPTGANLRDVAAASDADAWAVGDGGAVLRYGARGWEQIVAPTTATLYAVDALRDGQTWVAGGSADKGVTLVYSLGVWRDVPIPAAEPVLDIAVSAPGVGWAVSAGGIYRLEDYAWSRATNPATGLLDSIDLVGPDSGWIVGEDDTKLRLGESGWERVSPAPGGGGAALYAVDAFPGGYGWSAGYYGALWELRDDTWRAVGAPTRTNVYGLGGADAAHEWAVGEGGLILRVGDVRPQPTKPGTIVYLPWTILEDRSETVP